MKRKYYLCLLLLIPLIIKAQITTDQNWEPVFSDDFSGTLRGWNTTTFSEYGHPNILWRCMAGEYDCQVMSGDLNKAHVYQPSQCVFTNNTLKLVADYIQNGMLCGIDYIIPNTTDCEDCTDETRGYKTGIIQSCSKNFNYGYYEIRCKLPIHEGAHTSFWLFGCGPSTYEEVDIFEYSKNDSGGNYSPRGYSSGIHHNPNSASFDTNCKVFEELYEIPSNEPDLRQYHTYGCEWMPDYMRFYRDGKVVSEYRDTDHIPQYDKRIIVNYTIDKIKIGSNYYYPSWQSSDTLTIDYVKFYQLKTDCNTDVLITNSSQITNFDQRMKKSVSIGTTATNITFPATTNISIHAEEHITLKGIVEIPSGVQLTLSTHECPNNYNNKQRQ